LYASASDNKRTISIRIIMDHLYLISQPSVTKLKVTALSIPSAGANGTFTTMARSPVRPKISRTEKSGESSRRE